MRDRVLLARAIMALGHTVKPMPPIYGKPYVKRQKNGTAVHDEYHERSVPPRPYPSSVSVSSSLLQSHR